MKDVAASTGRYDWALHLVAIGVALSLAVWGYVLWFGFEAPPDPAPAGYRGFFELNNWWPFPLFFLALAPALWLTWTPFLRAWRKMGETGVLLSAEGRASAEDLDAVQRAVAGRRRVAVALALAIAVVVHIIDLAGVSRIYLGVASLQEQAAFACREPNALTKWMYEPKAEGGAGIVCPPPKKPDAPSAEEDEPHTTDDGTSIAATVPPGDGVPAPPAQLGLALLSVAMQFVLVFLVSLAVVQIFLHTFLFGGFERLRVARERGLRLRLNPASPVSEFGLEHWNYALNSFYWAASPALIPVFLSRTATQEAHYQPGQIMLGFLVPAALLLPMVLTIIVRQARLPELWARLEPNGDIDPEDYRRQLLWPLDRNWAAKLGIVLAFALSALALGINTARFVGL